ncbi:MAG TPA: hypothetical protein VEH00_02665 [Steroidobacteraceae bacterium]|nr:hypothetical protein [Steroidobacteraceae bacterium]
MSMTQLVIGTACGFLVAQGLLYGLGRLTGWLRQGDLLARVRAVRATPAPTVLGALIRYAAPVGVSVALVTLGVWAVSDYLAAKSAGNVEAKLFDTASVAAAEPSVPPVRAASLTPAPATEPVDEPAVALPDPYADPEFKVQHKPHRSAAAVSLKETLVQQSEARARNELLRELQQHVHRSQYDCEAAERADKYLKAGLDVWGFATWQVKYFPVDNYRGATLGQCRDIKNVVASSVDLQSAVAQQDQADPER